MELELTIVMCYYLAGGMGVSSSWSPLGNFIEGQEHPVIGTDVLSVLFCVLFFYDFISFLL